MKERPILFSAPMIRALLAGTKTQTRRVMKPQPHVFQDGEPVTYCGTPGAGQTKAIVCPYGTVGDRLWAREAFRHYANGETAGGKYACVTYRADDAAAKVPVAEWPPARALWNSGKHPWTPPIHMPRWASRITLEITGVRVERVQDINRGDCMEEGCPFPNMAKGADPREWFRNLWQSINGPDSWAANPWVWAMAFRVVTPATPLEDAK